jgi:hypothetical protein
VVKLSFLSITLGVPQQKRNFFHQIFLIFTGTLLNLDGFPPTPKPLLLRNCSYRSPSLSAKFTKNAFPKQCQTPFCCYEGKIGSVSQSGVFSFCELAPNLELWKSRLIAPHYSHKSDSPSNCGQVNSKELEQRGRYSRPSKITPPFMLLGF